MKVSCSLCLAARDDIPKSQVFVNKLVKPVEEPSAAIRKVRSECTSLYFSAS